MTLNCAHGARALPPCLVDGATITRNVDAIAATIDAVHPDVVALQEIDRRASGTAHLDEVAVVARGAHLPHAVFGEHAPRRGTAMLSRTPVREQRSQAFGTSVLDDKGWVQGTTAPEALGGREVDVVSVHLDPFTPWARHAQILRMAEALAHHVRPLVVMGDLNAAWGRHGRGDVARLARALDLHAWEPTRPLGTYPSGHPWRRIDWILLSSELQFVSYATVPPVSWMSDHRGVVADVTLRTHGWRG